MCPFPPSPALSCFPWCAENLQHHPLGRSYLAKPLGRDALRLDPEIKEGARARGRQSKDLLSCPLAQNHPGHSQLQLKREPQDEGQIQPWPPTQKTTPLSAECVGRDISGGREERTAPTPCSPIPGCLILPSQPHYLCLSSSSISLAIPTTSVLPQLSCLGLL